MQSRISVPKSVISVPKSVISVPKSVMSVPRGLARHFSAPKSHFSAPKTLRDLPTVAIHVKNTLLSTELTLFRTEPLGTLITRLTRYLARSCDGSEAMCVTNAKRYVYSDLSVFDDPVHTALCSLLCIFTHSLGV